MNDDQLLRYSRHVLLPQIDVQGQDAICQSKVLVLGVGGLGSPVAMYLTASGVAGITLVDDDVVDESNLQRQIIHQQENVGINKTESAKTLLQGLNPACEIRTFEHRLDEAELARILPEYNVVVDCTDNATSRYVLNKASLKTLTPLVSGAAIRFEGQVSVFDPRDKNSPCYQCLYDALGSQQLACAENGVFSPLVGVIGSMQALEALKLLAGLPSDLVGKVALFNGLKNSWQYLGLNKNPGCSACGG